MRFTSAILCIYLVGLFLQPALFTLHTNSAMSCCSKEKTNKAKHSCCTKNNDKGDCGDNGQCNPFFSQCPICAATGIPTAKFEFTPKTPFEYIAKQKFFSFDQNAVIGFHQDLLRPPAFV